MSRKEVAFELVEPARWELILTQRIVDDVTLDWEPVSFGDVLRLAGAGNPGAIKAMKLIRERGYIARGDV